MTVKHKCLMMSDLQSGAEQIEYVLASDYDRDLAEMRRQRDALKSATERLLWNFRLAIADKPVRDASETIAEAEAALTPKEPRDG